MSQENFSCTIICCVKVTLELSVLMLSCTVEGGHLHRLFPNVNKETAKYTEPNMQGEVYLAVSELTLGKSW